MTQTTEKSLIVKKVSIIDTFRAIGVGKTATFHSSDLGLYTSACSAVSRLNTAARRTEFSISTTDNGATYTITHNKD